MTTCDINIEGLVGGKYINLTGRRRKNRTKCDSSPHDLYFDKRSCGEFYGTLFSFDMYFARK